MQIDPPRSWISRYYRSFNGLRALAVLAVFFHHYGRMITQAVWVDGLWVGVDLFFVLSGFLITGILYDSKSRPDYFRSFYTRRALRVFPLYYGFFLLLYALSPLLHPEFQSRFWTNLLYVSNFVPRDVPGMNPTYVGLGGHPALGLVFGHLWSLCVEEQFYLLWPLVIWLLPTRRSMLWFAGSAALATLGFRIFLYFHDPAEIVRTASIYIVTYTRCDGLLIGAWLAVWLRGVKLTRQRLRSIAYAMLVPSATILLLGAATVGRRWNFNSVNPLICTYGYTLIGLAAAGMILLSLDEQGLLSRVLRNRSLNALGTISYGFYFLHEIPFVLISTWQGRFAGVRFSGPATVLATLIGITALAWVSFHFYESQFLKLKDRLSPTPSHASVP
jgi:peptidoglycan/LPS O-acetylase OafA/YrhL